MGILPASRDQLYARMPITINVNEFAIFWHFLDVKGVNQIQEILVGGAIGKKMEDLMSLLICVDMSYKWGGCTIWQDKNLPLGSYYRVVSVDRIISMNTYLGSEFKWAFVGDGYKEWCEWVEA